MIQVLRMGHRPARDARVTTHVALVARAFGADGIVVAERDPGIESTVRDIAERFGGSFAIRTGVPWKPYLRDWRKRGGAVVHLTMYGQPLLEGLAGLKADRDVLFVVGAEKVPGDLYELADLNLSVGNQPHSEVAALAIALDRWTQGSWTRRDFGGKVRVVPNPRGKTLIDERPSLRSTARRRSV